MLNKFIFTVLLIVISGVALAQEKPETITVVGDSLVGRVVDGESIREVYGNVILTQGNVRITCSQAVQYLSDNNAELIGDVVATQDTLTITTQRAFYYGDERLAESQSGVKLDDKKVILTAQVGKYYFDLDKAEFNTGVTLYDTTTTLTSDSLTYFKEQSKAVAVGNVKIIDPENIIRADSLTHFREKRITFATDNVSISSKQNNAVIYGDHLEDYGEREYTIIDKNPLLFQVDTTYIQKPDSLAQTAGIDTVQNFRLDTLVIKSRKMEAFRDTANLFIASDSVEIVRGSFASKNDYTIYRRADQIIETYKINRNAKAPIIWYENSQLTGDSVTVFLKDNEITKLDVKQNAFLLSQSENYPLRFDQISGSRVTINFVDQEIHETDVEGDVLSIYYLYDENEPNGLTKSSAQSAKIIFEENKVEEVKLYVAPNSEYYPEKMVNGNEKSYTLPNYVFYNNRPLKEKLLKSTKLIPSK